jgi:hypothetical protein
LLSLVVPTNWMKLIFEIQFHLIPELSVLVKYLIPLIEQDLVI